MLYVLALIGFVVVVLLVSKFNKGMVNRSVQKARAERQLPELARCLGLAHEFLKPSGNKGTFMETGERVHGTYRGFPIELIFAMEARYGDQIAVRYTYTARKTVTLTVKNSRGKSFQIMPKTKNLVSKPTGVESFDTLLRSHMRFRKQPMGEGR